MYTFIHEFILNLFILLRYEFYYSRIISYFCDTLLRNFSFVSSVELILFLYDVEQIRNLFWVDFINILTNFS